MDKRTSLELLYELLKRNPNASFWARELAVTPAALSIARIRGRLSPTMAAAAANWLGIHNPAPWVALAALEAERASHVRNKAIARMAQLLEDPSTSSRV